MAVTFEGYERREAKTSAIMKQYGIKDFDDALKICTDKGFNPYKITEGIQNICFENAKWAYTLGCAIAIKKGCTKAADAARAIGEGLQAFCIPGSVAEQRKVGLGHGNLAAMAARRRNRMLLLPRRSRIFRGCGRRNRYRKERKQGS